MKDGSLGTLHSCVATWYGVRSNYKIPLGHPDDTQDPPLPFNLRTGEPEEDVFSTSEDCPDNEYSRIVPDPPPEAFNNGKSTQINYEPFSFIESAYVQLYSDLKIGDKFEVRYYFHIVDTYDKRARAKSTSEEKEEYFSIAEVTSQSDSTPSATSGLFRGAAKGFSRQSMLVEYTDEGGDVITNSKTPTPIPTPTPSVWPTATYVPGIGGSPTPTPTNVSGAIKRKVSVEFSNTPATGDDTAVFHIYDNYLGTTKPCTVMWTDIPHEIDKNDPNDNKSRMPWNVVTGNPVPSAFSREGCEYNGSTQIIPIRASIDNDERFPGIEFPSDDSPYGLVSIAGKAPMGSTVKIHFRYEVIDAYPAQARRARVYSSSDEEGEWVAIREVTSESDSSSAAATYLYRGEIGISEDPASLAKGDGLVRVRTRSWLGVAYYNADDAVNPEARASVKLNLPTPTPTPMATPTATPSPTPTPIPAANPFVLALAVGAGALIALLRRKPNAPPTS